MDSSSRLPEPLHAGRVRRWHKVTISIVLTLLAVAGVARVLAPGYIHRAINRRLSHIPGYAGHVGDVELQLWRGAYRIDNIKIFKSNGKVREPFFTARTIDFSIAWGEMLKKKFVSSIDVTDGSLILLRGPTDETSQLTADHRWQDVIMDIFPIRITRLKIKGGVIRFVDTTHEPRVDIGIEHIDVVATGLRNRPSRRAEVFPATIDISGRSIGNGELRLNAKLEPLADQPHFKLALELRRVSLPALNELLRAYVGIDVSQGQFDVFGQMAMQNGHYEGYLKPFLNQVDFRNDGDAGRKLGARIRKDVLVSVIKLFRNRDTKQLATRIPFSGDAQNMDVGTLRTIVNGLHHGFIAALPQGFEGTTHPDAAESELPPMPPAVSGPVSTAKPMP